MNAPLRRIDNEISRLTDYVSALSMHCSLLDRVVAQYRDQLWTGRCRVLLAAAAGTAATAAAVFLCDRLFPDPAAAAAASIKSHSHIGSIAGQGGAAPLISPSSSGSTSSLLSKLLLPQQLIVMVTAGMGAVGTAAVYLWQRTCLYGTMKQLRSRPYIESLMGQLSSKPTATRDDESVSTMSRHVLDRFFFSSSSSSGVDDALIQTSDRVRGVEFAALKRILGEDIPHLRRQATPSQPEVVHRSCLDEDCFLSNTAEPDMKTDSSPDMKTDSSPDMKTDSSPDDGPTSTGDHDDGPASTGDHCSDSNSVDETSSSAGSSVPSFEAPV